MDQMNDIDLVADYVTRNSQEAFATLVQRHIHLVYAVALRHLGDPSKAEDVTQAAFIALARRAPSLRKGTILAGWLHQTTRNLSLSAVRAETRRRRREQEAFMRSSFTDLPGQAPWEKLAPALDEALTRLGTKDRNAILLRFFEGRSVPEVGLALGLKEPAAKKRIGRALEKIRTFFARRGIVTSVGALAGAMAANSIQAAPAGLAERILRHPSVAAGAGLGLLPNVLALLSAVKTPLLVGGACAAMAIAGALLHHSVQRGSSVASLGPAPTPPLRSLSGRPGIADRGAAADVSRDPLAGSTNPANQLLLEIVTADSGKPVPNVQIEYWRHEGQRPAFHGSLQSSRLGVCKVPVARDTATRLQVVSEVDGFAETCLDWEKSCGDPIPEHYTLRLGRSTPIAGRVVDADGAPVAGAEVTFNNQWDPASEARPQTDNFRDLFRVTAVTDAEGRWQIDRVAKATIHTLWGWANHAEHVGSPFIHVDRDRQVEDQLLAGAYAFHLSRAVAVRGLVLDPAGLPVSGASVQVQAALETTHEEERAPGPVTARAQQRESTTRTDGTFSLAGCQPGKNRLTASARGFAAKTLEIELVQDSEPLQLTLQPGPILRVHVVNQAGLPVPGAVVRLNHDPLLWDKDPHGKPLPPTQVQFAAKTDENGRVLWDSAPNQELRFDVFAKNYLRVWGARLRPDGQEHTITLSPALAISGSVRDATTGQPIPKFRILTGWPRVERRPVPHNAFVWESTTNAWWPEQNWQTYQGGSFRHVREWPVVANAPDPRFLFKVEAEGYAPWVSRVVTAEEGEVRMDVALRRALATLITVLLPDGRPAARAEIGLVSPTAGLQLAPGGFSRENAPTGGSLDAADQQGRFTLPVDDTVSRIIAAHAEGYAEASLAQLANEPIITLQPWGRLEGTCLSQGQPTAGRELLFQYANGHQFGSVSSDLMAYRTKTDRDGRFAFPKVPPGKHTLMRVVWDKRPGGDVDTHVPLQKLQIPAGQTILVTVDESAPPPETWQDSDFPGETTTPATVAPGYRVTTRLRWPEGLKQTANCNVFVLVQTPPPPRPVEAQSDIKAFAAWLVSPEAQAALAKQRQYRLTKTPDGEYAVEGVPAGDYILTAAVSKVPDRAKPAQAELRVYGELPLTIPADPPSGRLDLPEVVLKPMP